MSVVLTGLAKWRRAKPEHHSWSPTVVLQSYWLKSSPAYIAVLAAIIWHGVKMGTSTVRYMRRKSHAIYNEIQKDFWSTMSELLGQAIRTFDIRETSNSVRTRKYRFVAIWRPINTWLSGQTSYGLHIIYRWMIKVVDFYGFGYVSVLMRNYTGSIYEY